MLKVEGLSDWSSCFELSRNHSTTTPAFKTETVSSEYIVKFAGFYIEKTRKKYIDHSLKGFDTSQYEIVHRSNPMAAYPSDFDLLVSTGSEYRTSKNNIHLKTGHIVVWFSNGDLA
jgi:hypothetical protein